MRHRGYIAPPSPNRKPETDILKYLIWVLISHGDFNTQERQNIIRKYLQFKKAGGLDGTLTKQGG